MPNQTERAEMRLEGTALLGTCDRSRTIKNRGVKTLSRLFPSIHCLINQGHFTLDTDQKLQGHVADFGISDMIKFLSQSSDAINSTTVFHRYNIQTGT